VVETVPFTKEGAAAIAPIMEGIQSAYEKNLADIMSDAKRKLHGSVTPVVQAARFRMTIAEPKMQKQDPKAAEARLLGWTARRPTPTM
jgi:hypothetical protein